MKKKFLLFMSSIALASLSLMSNNSGPGGNLTGSDGGTTTGCQQNGCHSGGSYTSQATLTLYDSTGSTIMDTWIPNYPHRVVVGAQTNAPKWGFQASSSYFNGTNQQAAGTFSNLSSATQSYTASAFPMVQHTSAISAATTQFR